jgi:hypothetical protein
VTPSQQKQSKLGREKWKIKTTSVNVLFVIFVSFVLILSFEYVDCAGTCANNYPQHHVIKTTSLLSWININHAKSLKVQIYVFGFYPFIASKISVCYTKLVTTM